MDPDSGGPKRYGSRSDSATLIESFPKFTEVIQSDCRHWREDSCCSKSLCAEGFSLLLFVSYGKYTTWKSSSLSRVRARLCICWVNAHVDSAYSVTLIRRQRCQICNECRSTLRDTPLIPSALKVIGTSEFARELECKKVVLSYLSLCWANLLQGNQGVTKRCRLSWLTHSALVYEPTCGS
jgi:hypothetical protein